VPARQDRRHHRGQRLNDHHDDLLRPSLSGTNAQATAIHSAFTGYLVAFLGGPVAAAVIALINSRRLRRLSKDWPIALLALALLHTMLWWELRDGGDKWLTDLLGSSGPRAFRSVVSLLFFCGIYLLHYRSYRSMQLLGIKAPSGWVPGIIAVLIGFCVSFFFVAILNP
jgi:hypothetical protein